MTMSSASAASPPQTPTQKLSFSVDSLLAKADGQRRSSSDQSPECSAALTNDIDSADMTSELSDDRSTPDSLEQSPDHTTNRVTADNMAAMLRQRAELLRHTQLPNSPLVYPWLMSTAGVLTNPAAAAFLNPSAFPNPGKSVKTTCIT